MKKILLSYVGLAVFVLSMSLLNSCGVAKQLGETLTLAKCDFRMESVQNLKLAGVNVQNISSLKQLRPLDAAALTAAMLGNKPLPLDLTMNLEAKNPNPKPAGLTGLGWILYIDDVEMNQGMLNQPFSIPGNGNTAIIPLNMRVDLRQVLSGKSADAIINFAMNLAGAGNKPTRFKMKLKPTIMIGTIPISYPGYISIGQEFGAQQVNK